MSRSFQRYASYYDLIYKDKDYERECDFIEKLFKKFCHNNPKTILDIGCGTGGHAIPLRTRGYKVTGIDASGPMIEVARKKSQEKGLDIDFSVMDMQGLNLRKRFDVVISMFASINYITSHSSLRGLLYGVRSCMKDDSVFIFDFWNGYAVLNNLSPLKKKTVQDKGRKIIRTSRTRVIPIPQICTVDFDFQVLENNKRVNRFKETHILRFFFPAEMSAYLEACGLEVISMCPFLNPDREINPKTWNVTIVARLSPS